MCPQHRFPEIVNIFYSESDINSCLLSRYLFVDNVCHVGSGDWELSLLCTIETEAEILMFDSWVVGRVHSVVTLTDNDVG